MTTPTHEAVHREAMKLLPVAAAVLLLLSLVQGLANQSAHKRVRALEMRIAALEKASAKPAVDYDAIAKKYGGTTEKPDATSVDWSKYPIDTHACKEVKTPPDMKLPPGAVLLNCNPTSTNF